MNFSKEPRQLLVLALLLLGLLPERSSANIMLELGLNGGYTDNLLSDSSGVVDRYSTSSATLRFYPNSNYELRTTGEATFYSAQTGLSNKLARLGATWIPLNAESRFSIYVSGDFDLLRYRSQFGRFNTNNIDARAAFGYRLGTVANLRWGVRLQSTEYLGSSSGDKASIESFAGINTTFWRDNSFDCEFGYGIMDYRFIDPALEYIDIEQPEAALTGGKLRSIYVSPRVSRPLGSRTGANVTFTYHHFLGDEDEIVYGSSVGLLSPWTSVWEGTSIVANVKSFLLPGFISTFGCGYWNRRHLRTIENGLYPLVIGRERDDDQARMYLQFVRPIAVGSGKILQPRIQIDYSNNNSSNELFDYSGASIST
ncbi:MAG: hypothetical protein WBP29_01095, partial [Candidatus Zixiibacteriota bacterium]